MIPAKPTAGERRVFHVVIDDAAGEYFLARPNYEIDLAGRDLRKRLRVAALWAMSRDAALGELEHSPCSYLQVCW